MTYHKRQRRPRSGGKPRRPSSRKRPGVDEDVAREQKKAAEIRKAIKHFLAGSIGNRTEGAISPSRFRNLCRRYERLLPPILESLNEADRRVIEKILLGGK